MHVIIDDLSRLARSLNVQHALEKRIEDNNGILISPLIDFNKNPDSNLVRNLMGSVNAHMREKNAEQVRNRMWARVHSGIDIIGRPKFGYYYGPNPRGIGQMPLLHPHNAPIVKDALHSYANGKLRSVVDVMHFINERRPIRSEGRSKGKTFNCTHDIARALIDNALFYAGYIHYPQHGIENLKGEHERLIDYSTYLKISGRRAGRGIRTYYKQNEGEYPLKGSLLCDACGKALTSSGKGSRGRNHKGYLYYVCKQSGCSLRNKGILAEKAHELFADLLEPMQPSNVILDITESIMWTVFNEQVQYLDKERSKWLREKRELEKQIEEYVDGLLGADERTKKALKSRISQLVQKQEDLETLINNRTLTEKEFGRALAKVFTVLHNPQHAWLHGTLNRRRTIQRLAFPKHIRMQKGKTFRKPEKALLFCLTEKLASENLGLVGGSGFEPPTSTMST